MDPSPVSQQLNESSDQPASVKKARSPGPAEVPTLPLRIWVLDEFVIFCAMMMGLALAFDAMRMSTRQALPAALSLYVLVTVGRIARQRRRGALSLGTLRQRLGGTATDFLVGVPCLILLARWSRWNNAMLCKTGTILNDLFYAGYVAFHEPVMRLSAQSDLKPGDFPVEPLAGVIPFVKAIPLLAGMDYHKAVALVGSIGAGLLCYLVTGFFPRRYRWAIWPPVTCVVMWVSLYVTYTYNSKFLALVFVAAIALRMDTPESVRKYVILALAALCLAWTHLTVTLVGGFVVFAWMVSLVVVRGSLWPVLAGLPVLIGVCGGAAGAGYQRLFSHTGSVAAIAGSAAVTEPTFIPGLMLEAPLIALLAWWVAGGYRTRLAAFLTVFAAFVVLWQPALSTRAHDWGGTQYLVFGSHWIMRVVLMASGCALVAYSALALVGRPLEYLGRRLFRRACDPEPTRRVLAMAHIAAVVGILILPGLWETIKHEQDLRRVNEGSSVTVYSALRQINDRFKAGSCVLTQPDMAQILAMYTRAVPAGYTAHESPMNVDWALNGNARRQDLDTLYETDDVTRVYEILDKYKSRHVLLDNLNRYSHHEYLRGMGAKESARCPRGSWLLLEFPPNPAPSPVKVVHIEAEDAFERFNPSDAFRTGSASGSEYSGGGYMLSTARSESVSLSLEDYPRIRAMSVRVVDFMIPQRLFICFKARDGKTRFETKLDFGGLNGKQLVRLPVDLPKGVTDTALSELQIAVTPELGTGPVVLDQIVLLVDNPTATATSQAALSPTACGRASSGSTSFSPERSRTDR